MPIQYLAIPYCPISDIAAVRGMPLVAIDLQNTRVTDLRPLLDCPTLEIICLPPAAKDIAILRTLPKLKYLSTEWGKSATEPPKETLI